MQYEQSIAANISEQEMTFRTAISNDPVLLHFLQTGTIGSNERFTKQMIYKDPAFVTFISPYFQDAYVKATINALDLKDSNLMSAVAANPILLDYQHRQQASDQILVYLEEKKAKLAALHYKIIMHEPMDFMELPDFTNITTITNLNYLPGEFLDFRSAYAGVAMKVVKSIANQDIKMSLNMNTNLRELIVDMQTLQEIMEFYKIINSADNEQKAMECERAHRWHRHHRYGHWWDI